MPSLPPSAAHVAIDILRLAAWLALLAVIFVPLERLFALHPAKIFRSGVGADLGYYVLSGLLPGLLLGAPLALVAAAAHGMVPGGVHAAVAQAPFWQRACLGFLLGEIGVYWGHRWSHEIPLLWRFHAIHHSAPHMDFLVHTRAHPVDLVFTRLCGLVPLYVLGLGGPGAGGDAVPLLVVLTGTVWGFFIHANIRVRLGPLEWLVATPAFHHWHHTRADHANRNYASTLPALDRLFGTHFLPRAWPAAYGIEAAMPASLAAQLVSPIRYAAAANAPAAVTQPS